MRKLFLTLIMSAIIGLTFGQKPICVVDGFFLKMDKDEAIDYLGADFISDTTTILSDSAMTLLGDYGSNGLFVIKTMDPKSNKSMSLRTGDKLFFTDVPTIYINGIMKLNFDLNTINPQKVDSIEIITPLTAVREEGIEFVGGKIKIWLKD